ncbi:MAG TPA: 1,2-phenylacetyl-CoA epoxidase subunit PaaD [Chitinophagaceae bacterium]|nr:1,2-phenylacetyl-CoA epoxidase subunit PaaD [Chitinophagaceae bacterium]
MKKENEHNIEEASLNEEKKIWSILKDIPDPEVPVLSILDLGIVRSIKLSQCPPPNGGDWDIEVIITPTYSGCPAMDMIAANIRFALLQNGFKNIKITTVLSPAWTTDWMSEEGKQKLKEYGIAPPNPKQQVCNNELFAPHEVVQCPRCNSYHTHRISEFGSTACKALYQCDKCSEPFDYFKCH